MLQKQVITDIRKYLDVDEGLRCLIWGKPDYIDSNKIELYKSYIVPNKKATNESDTGSQKSGKTEKSEKSAVSTETFF